MKDFKYIFSVFVCFAIVFWLDCISPNMIGRVCIALSAGFLGFCIGLYKGCGMYQENGEEGGVQIGSVKIYSKKDEE